MLARVFKIFLFVLSVIMGLVFIYSGYTKLYPIEPFEYTLVDIGVAGWKLAPFLARFMIGLEFFIGLMLVFNLYIKRFTAKLTIATLIFFSIYLLIVIATSGNNGNCGCFGNALVMTPLQALIKNAVMIAIGFVLLKFHDGFDIGKFGKWLSILNLLSAMVMPHILNYVDFDYSAAYLNKPGENFNLALDSLYKDAKINAPPRSLSQGKHLIAFMSATCPHCRVAAKKLRLILEKNPSIPVYLVLNGDDDKFKLFFEDTKATNIPYCRLNGRNFIYLAGVTMPQIFLVNNSKVEANLNYMELDQSEIEKWLAR